MCLFVGWMVYDMYIEREKERGREGGNTDDIGTTARTSPVSGRSSMESKPAVRGPSVYLSRYPVQYSSLQLKRRGLIILVSNASRPQDKNSCGDHGETHRSTNDAPPFLRLILIISRISCNSAYMT